MAACLVVAPVSFVTELPPDSLYEYHDVVLVEAQDGSFYPAVVTGLSKNWEPTTVLVKTLHSHMRGRRTTRFVPGERVHAAIWTFTGYRKKPC